MSVANAGGSGTGERRRVALIHVRVFDGQRLLDPGTVVIDGDVIGTDAAGAELIDGHGAVLLPGLIDAHVHLHGRETLERLCSFGVTTALDMGCWPPALVQSLREVEGLTQICSPGVPAVAPGGTHARIPDFPADGIVTGPQEAEAFVAARVAEEADYIKVITEVPGPGALDQPTLNALVAAAHAHGKLVIAHSARAAAYGMAQEAKVDVVTHAPLDRALDAASVARMAAEGRVAVPTLTMMEGIVQQAGRPGPSYEAARASVHALYRAGVPVLAGTDANASPGVPANIPHGESLHRELELLVEAGLSTMDALRAATVLPAKHFGLADRGAIAPGMRADLVLIEGDPIADIRATRHLRRIWCGGHEIAPGRG